jgi:DNA mismatch repair protein MSH6
MADQTFSERFHRMAKNTPDLERLISRIHAGRCKQSDFLKVLDAFKKLNSGFGQLSATAQSFSSASVASLLRNAPDMTANLAHIQSMYEIVDGGMWSLSALSMRTQTRICRYPAHAGS